MQTCALSRTQASTYDGPKRDVLIDVGTADPYLAEQLRPDDFVQAATSNKALKVQLRKQARRLALLFAIFTQRTQATNIVSMPRVAHPTGCI